MHVKTFEERMRELAGVRGEIDVFQWDPKAYAKPEEVPESHKVYLVKKARNKLVRNFSIAFYDKFTVETEPVIDVNGTSRTPRYFYEIAVNYTTRTWEGVRLGTDTTTPTEPTTYNLASPISVDADSRAKGYFDNGIVFTSTWSAGKITQQVGEIGLIGHVVTETSLTGVLLARCASADGAFQPFTPDPTLNLTVNYRIKW